VKGNRYYAQMDQKEEKQEREKHTNRRLWGGEEGMKWGKKPPLPDAECPFFFLEFVVSRVLCR